MLHPRDLTDFQDLRCGGIRGGTWTSIWVSVEIPSLWHVKRIDVIVGPHAPLAAGAVDKSTNASDSIAAATGTADPMTMVLKPAVKHQRVAQAIVPRDNH